MPESAARINPLRPRVCTIRLCLGEPPLRGARVRAGSLVLLHRSYIHVHSQRRHIHTHAHTHTYIHLRTTLVTLARTSWWGENARIASWESVRPPQSLRLPHPPSERVTSKLKIEHHWPRHVPESPPRLVANPTNALADSSTRATPRTTRARTTSFTGE